MGDAYNRPICSFLEGEDWIDSGTLSLSRLNAPVPTGTAEPAAPAAAGRKPGEKAMFDEDIKIIAKSPLGLTSAGKEIVALLREYQKRDGIVYGPTHGDPPPRGEWDGTTITVRDDYYPNAYKTAVELVHEAAHVIWRRGHRLGKGKTESVEEGAANEYFAVSKQIAMYKWLRDVKHCGADYELDRRLEQEANGTLKSAIEAREKESRGSQQ